MAKTQKYLSNKLVNPLSIFPNCVIVLHMYLSARGGTCYRAREGERGHRELRLLMGAPRVGRVTGSIARVEREDEDAAPAVATVSTTEAKLSLSSRSGGSKAAAIGAKRRARARQLGELRVPAAAFDFSICKSSSLRDWLRQGGPIFSSGSYVMPRFGTSPTPPEVGGRR